MWRMHDEPQGVVRAPISAGGTAHVRALREGAATGAAFDAPDVEASQLDAWLALGARTAIAKSGPEDRGRGLAEAR
jgi:hypothetical protein